MEEMIVRDKDVNPRFYNWHNFKHQNEIALGLLQNWTSPIDYEIINAYAVNILRPDQHLNPKAGDCLHSCAPGKVEVYNRMLLNSMLRSRTLWDVEKLENVSLPWKPKSNVQADGLDVSFRTSIQN